MNGAAWQNRPNQKVIEYYWKLFPLYLSDFTISITGNTAIVLQKDIILQDYYMDKQGINKWF
jgi:hypothetical protein